MFFQQFYLGCLAQASYMIGDEAAGIAAVVDPRRDVDEYLQVAERHGMKIKHVLLTHFHADFLAGHLELRERCGATIYLGARAEAEYGFTPLAEGDTVEFGAVRLQALETPGHTPEGISILLFDTAANADTPQAVLTGDTLFIGDVGRPDLMASVGVTADELAGMLYDSLHNKLLALPDETLVYPAHGAGSMCGKNISTDTVSALGNQRRFNYALQPMTREKFIAVVTADQPEAPAYFAYNAMLNKSERAVLHENLAKALRPLPLDEALRLRDAGHLVLDTRDMARFAAGHLRGAVNISLDGKFATWVGTLLDQDRPIVMICDPGREEESATRLGRIGYDRVDGYLQGGMAALAGRDELVTTLRRIDATSLRDRLEDTGKPPFVLDVRTPQEYAGGALPGGVNIPLQQLEKRLDEIPRDREIFVHCRTGYRSSSAASLMETAGFKTVTDLVGGYEAWLALNPSARN